MHARRTYRGGYAIFITRKNRCHFFWVSNDAETGGAGIPLAEKWVERIFDVNRVFHGIFIKIISLIFVAETIITVNNYTGLK